MSQSTKQIQGCMSITQSSNQSISQSNQRGLNHLCCCLGFQGQPNCHLRSINNQTEDQSYQTSDGMKVAGKRQNMNESTIQSTNQPINHSIDSNQAIKQSSHPVMIINQFTINRSTNQKIQTTIVLRVDVLTSFYQLTSVWCTINWTIHPSIHQSITLSPQGAGTDLGHGWDIVILLNQAWQRLKLRSTNQPVNQPNTLTRNQTIKQSSNQANKQSLLPSFGSIGLIDQSSNPPMRWSINQSGWATQGVSAAETWTRKLRFVAIIFLRWCRFA